MRDALLVILAAVVLIAGGWWFTRDKEDTRARDQIGITVPTSTPEPTPSPSPGPDTLERDIKKQIADKFGKKEDDVQITTEKKTNTHAYGDLRFVEEGGGALWYAAKENDSWKLAYDGQQVMDCITAENYKFPKDIVKQCYDEKSNSVKTR